MSSPLIFGAPLMSGSPREQRRTLTPASLDHEGRMRCECGRNVGRYGHTITCRTVGDEVLEPVCKRCFHDTPAIFQRLHRWRQGDDGNRD